MAATAFEVGAKLLCARDTVRAHLGDRYEATMKEVGDYIDDIAARDGIPRVQAMMILCEDAPPNATLFALAAFVELEMQA